jgi:hypothetical protein
MRKPSPKDELNWVCGNTSLQQFIDRYPGIWEDAGQELVSILEDGRAQTLNQYVSKARSTAEMWKEKIRKSRNNLMLIEAALPHIVRGRMALLAMEQCYQAAATGKTSGKVRFNILNGLLIQRLLFSHHLTRKPASLGWFNFWWRLISQKRLLMPLVQPRGIYCFYSQKLIRELALLIGNGDCLEIGAGDGTLTRFLANRGVKIRATDNQSWKHAIEYPESVEPLDAKQALDKYQPQTVICSWPPPGNNFERHVFTTKSVDLYLVLGSRYKFASGNWDAYAAQSRFDWAIDERLSCYLIPPELECSVVVFRRK